MYELIQTIPLHEKKIVAIHVEDFFESLLLVDGLDPEEEERLTGFMNYLIEAGIPINRKTPGTPDILPETPPTKPDCNNPTELDNDPLKITIDDISSKLSTNTGSYTPKKGLLNEISSKITSALPPILTRRNSVPLKRIDHYPPIYYSYYKEYDNKHGPYELSKLIKYDYEGKNPEFLFEGDNKRFSLDDIKYIWEIVRFNKTS